MKKFVYFLCLLGFSLLTACANLGKDGGKNVSEQSKTKLPKLFDIEAHRGGRDARPEATLQAFAYSLAIGVTTLEMDMQITSDGVIVVRHDRSIPWFEAKNSWGKFLVHDEEPDIRFTDLATLKRFDLGEMSPNAPYGYWEAHGRTQKPCSGARICTLEEVFQLVKDWGNDNLFLNIETKSYLHPEVVNNPDPKEFVKKFYDLVVKYNMQKRVFLQSFDWRTLVEMKKLDPSIPTVALTAMQPDWDKVALEGDYQGPKAGKPSPWMAGLDIKNYDNSALKAAHAIKADIFSPYYTELTPDIIQEAHSYGMRVVPYVVNKPEDMRNLIKMGVDGIITDRPATLRKVCIEMGIPVPEPDPNPEKKPYYTGTDGL